MYTYFTIKTFHFVLYNTQNWVITFLNNIKYWVFVLCMHGIYCKVGNEFLYIFLCEIQAVFASSGPNWEAERKEMASKMKLTVYRTWSCVN